MNNKIVQKVSKKEAGKRFDEAAALLFDITKSRAQKLIKAGTIKLNNETTSPKTTVQAGDSLEQNMSKKGGEVEIPILYQDRGFMVVNKPAGVTVHPADGEEDWTVLELLSQKIGKELFIVHRLDKGTSGVMVLAKNKKTRDNLQEQFKKRTVQKSYLALVEGHIQPEKGIIDIPLGREETVRNKIGPLVGGRSAITEYEVVEFLKDFSYLEVNPKTGRTHQIRAHFSAIGYPIVGDERYGGKMGVSPRIFLHAFSISFIHPKEMRRTSFQSSLPKDLDDVLLRLK